MKSKYLILAVALFVASVAGAAEPPDGGEGMPLAVYQKIKAHFDALYGARTVLLPGVKPAGREETLKSLREDAAANKDVLLAALSKGGVIHRELAARALEYCGDKKAAVEALAKAVTADADENVRRAAAAALAKLPDAMAVDQLLKALLDSSESVRGVAASALGNIKDSRACDALLKVLADDSQPMVRLQAATALSKIKEPASLEALKKLLDSEKDERVKLAIVGAIRSMMGPEKDEEKAVTAEEASNELAALAKEMKEVEEKLRSDRHDQAVQVQGSGIEQKLAALIEKISQSSSSSSQQQQQQQQQQSQQKQSGGKANNGKSGGSPLADSKLGAAVPPGAVNPAIVTGKQDAWAKLPPAQRDELLQAYREEMPERWRKRLEAYFYSLNAEESKNADR